MGSCRLWWQLILKPPLCPLDIKSKSSHCVCSRVMFKLQDFSELPCENDIYVDYSTFALHCRWIYKEFMVSSICQYVWRLVGGMNFHKTWMEDESQPDADPDKGIYPFFFSLSLTLQDRDCFFFFVNFSGNNAWILMKTLGKKWDCWA